MAKCILENIKMIKKWVMESIDGQMVDNIWEIGIMKNNTGWEYFKKTQIVNPRKAFGRKAKL